MVCCGTTLLCYAILGGSLYGGYILLQKFLMQRKLDRFDKSKCPKDKVILHGTPRTRYVPAASPFVLKLETFMRMAKIQYEYDGNPVNTFGPKGKTPWISLNGEHVADSELCIDFLTKKYNVNLKDNYSEREKASATMLRYMLEDRAFWQFVMWGFVWGGEGHAAVQKVIGLPWLAVKYMQRIYTKSAWYQGIGRQDRESIEKWISKDMKTIATVLGNNKFILGDEPCLEDCAVFGFFAQMLWGFPSFSPYVRSVQKEFPNFEAYCNRMKHLYFPDWDQLLKKKKN